MNRRNVIFCAIGVSASALLVFSQTDPLPRFEVASIKQNTTTVPQVRGGGPLPGGRLVMTNVPARFLVQNAYAIRSFQIVGGPDWMNSVNYDIDARAGEGAAATPAQLNLMLRGLLEDRFKLKFHRETSELPVYELVAARGGLKLRQEEGSCVTAPAGAPPPRGGAPLPPPPPPPPGPGQPFPRPTQLPCGRGTIGISPSGARIDGGKLPMAEFVRLLSTMLDRNIIDKTGYAEPFDVHLEFLPDQSLAGVPGFNPNLSADLGGISIFTAVQEQLGLRLDSTRGPVDVLVIDSIERPSEN